MKKLLFGLIALVIAISAVAFTNVNKARFGDVYFSYDASENLIYPTNPLVPPPQVLPSECNGIDKKCAGRYSGATFNQTTQRWEPNGSELQLYKRPI